LLAEMVRQPLAHDARHDVDRAAGREADQPAHRTVRDSRRGAGAVVAAKLERQARAKKAARKNAIMRFRCFPFRCRILYLPRIVEIFI